MRDTSTMNDFLEVEHGFQCLNAAYGSNSGKALRDAIDMHYPDLSAEVLAKFNKWLPAIRQGTYLTCVSEHFDGEDQNGRLSMWRAYGGKAGVALVINPKMMFLPNENIGVFASPVAYWTQPEVEGELLRISQRINENAEFVRGLTREVARDILFNMYHFAVLCTKHPGFSEEREWRIIASPSMYPSPLLNQSIEVIHGTPQTIQKLQLRNHTEKGIVGLDPPEMLNRVIIGPCEYPGVIRRALHQALLGASVSEPEHLIGVSDIPLRAPTL